MAYGGLQSWELLCPLCKTFIDSNNNDDFQASLDIHYLSVHPTLRGLSQSNNQMPAFKSVKYMNEEKVNKSRKECTNYIICPLCDSVVEIFQNNINHFFLEHFEIHHQNFLELDAAHNFSTQGHSSEIFEDVEKNPGALSDLPNMNSKSWSMNDLFDLPPDLEKHSGYIIFNSNHFLCHICRETMNTHKIMEDHLRTKKHEDNVINLLKDKLAKHMQSAMEFVSFYGSNLCCNLCRCKIHLNSKNPHETLLNIISHNTDVKHSKAKFHKNPSRQCNAVYTILKSVTEKNPLINEHRDFIEAEMKPHFKCKLCEKIIHFSKNDFELEQNFLTHINSVLHSKNSKAMTVLQFFIEVNGGRNGEHCFSVLNGVINCAQCKCSIIANVEQLLDHCQRKSSENKKNRCFPLSSDKLLNTELPNSPLEINSGSNITCGALSNFSVNSSQIARLKINKPKEEKKLDVKEILHPLQSQFGNITCIAESEDGKLTCLICNCSIQPSTHCVKMHIIGKFHKNKTHCQIKELNTLNLNSEETNQEANLNFGGTSRESYQDLIEHLFQALPTKFQEEKDFCTINLTDGSINCTLCDCIIDPLFIEVHLQEETHLYQKQLKRA